jgi:hypothetical protein
VGDDPPESAAKMVQVYVSGLRKVLPDGMRGRAGLVAAARERLTEGLDTPDLREAAALLDDGGVPVARTVK